MYSEELAGIDLSPRQTLIQSLLGFEVSLALTDSSGILLHTAAAAGFDIAPHCAALIASSAEATGDHICSSAATADSPALIGAQIKSEHDDTIAWLFMFGKELLSKPELAHHLLLHVRDGLSREIRTERELNDMATELTIRYDELNLVYQADDLMSAKIAEFEALERIAEHFIEFLSIDGAILHLPGKNIDIREGFESSTDELRLQVDNTVLPLLHKLRETKSALVFNQLEHIDFSEQPCDSKLIAAPIYTPTGDVDGILLLARSPAAVSFSNSDRNLAEVMSRRITQLLQGSYDALTGCFNRQAFEHRVAAAVSDVRRRSTSHCVLNVDIDDLHVINEMAGFSAGDTVIRDIGELIGRQLRDDDCVARLGANEFGVLLNACPIEYAEKCAQKICDAVTRYTLDSSEKDIYVSVSIGLAPISKPNEKVADILSYAELAQQEAKALGKNRVYGYFKHQKDIELRQDQVKWVSNIRAAIRGNEFRVYAQEIASLRNYPDENPKEVHFEALIRLQDKDGKVLSPFAFLPAAERYRLMPEIDRWMMNQTLRALAARADVLRDCSLTASINLSGQSIGDPQFTAFALDAIEKYPLPAETLCFEITESAAIANLAAARRFIETFRDLGVRFSLDDFGTGLSSFQYLKSMPIDHLKIDGYFIRRIQEDRISAAIVKAIYYIAVSMNLKTVAEYVETDDIARILRNAGIDYGQGYGIAKPIPISDYLDGKGLSTDNAGAGRTSQ